MAVGAAVALGSTVAWGAGAGRVWETQPAIASERTMAANATGLNSIMHRLACGVVITIYIRGASRLPLSQRYFVASAAKSPAIPAMPNAMKSMAARAKKKGIVLLGHASHRESR